MDQSFSLLTLNCFGLWMPGTKRRLLALAEALNAGDHQVVCLQEIQLNSYQESLVKACRDFPYSHFERYVHCPKGGLLTLSRNPILNKSFVRYEERGFWYTPMLLDRLFYKGMLITTLTWANVRFIIINTHILANYVGDWERGGMYSRVEQKQLQQLAKTVQAQPPDSFVLVVGDFNIPRDSYLYQDFLVDSELTDPLAGDTRPTVRPPLGLQSRYSIAIDYALYRSPAKIPFNASCDFRFSRKYQIKRGHFDYLSDHVGIEIEITKR